MLFRSLVKPAAESKFLEQNLKPGEDPVPGVRAQICVTDYNRDGLLDLIVGDYSDVNWTRELTDEERTEFEQVKEELTEISESLPPVREAMFSKDASEVLKKEKEAEYQTIVEQLMKLDKKRLTFYRESRRASFVWLYLRKGSSDTNSISENQKDVIDSVPLGSKSKGEPDREGPVSVDVKLEPSTSASKRLLTVTFDVKRNWHLYSMAPTGFGYQTTNVELVLPPGVSSNGEWQKPDGEFSLKNTSTRIYTRTVTFSREIEFEPEAASREIGIKISCQACNANLCLPTVKMQKSVTFKSP